MRKQIQRLLATLIFSCFGLLSIAQQAIASLAELEQAPIISGLVYVTDAKSGGVFYYSKEIKEADGGTIFRSGFGGSWIRTIGASASINPCWWGATGDGLHDDIQAIENATKYCLKNSRILEFPSGIFRITRQWVIGGKPVQEKDIFSRKLADAPSWNIREYEKSRFTAPIIIRGNVQTILFGDFDPPALEAILYFGLISNGNSNRPAPQFYTHEISNIGFYGRSTYNKGNFRQIERASIASKQIGLLIYRTQSIRVDGCKFYGMDYGIVAQDTYFSEISRTMFSTCKLGFEGIGFNANHLQNVVADNCVTGMKIWGSALVAEGIHFEFCETALEYKGEGFVINGMYCENDNLKKGNLHQLVFRGASGVIINGANITSGNRQIIFLDDKTADISINSSALYGPITTSHNRNYIKINSSKGRFNIKGPARVENNQ